MARFHDPKTCVLCSAFRAAAGERAMGEGESVAHAAAQEAAIRAAKNVEISEFDPTPPLGDEKISEVPPATKGGGSGEEGSMSIVPIAVVAIAVVILALGCFRRDDHKGPCPYRPVPPAAAPSPSPTPRSQEPDPWNPCTVCPQRVPPDTLWTSR